jgi:hypothetical protein
MDAEVGRPQIPLSAFTGVFVPWALLMVAGFLYYHVSSFPEHFRIVATIWIVWPFVAVSLGLRAAGRSGSVALLTWTVGFVAFLLHQILAVADMFGGDLGAVFARQGVTAAMNFALAIWWAVDLYFMWSDRPQPRWVHLQRVAFAIALVIAMFVASVILKEGFVRYLAISSILFGLLIAWLGAPPRLFKDRLIRWNAPR